MNTKHIVKYLKLFIVITLSSSVLVLLVISLIGRDNFSFKDNTSRQKEVKSQTGRSSNINGSIKKKNDIQSSQGESSIPKYDKFQQLDYLYGSWVCVDHGIRLETRISSDYRYFWSDDLGGRSIGTWEGSPKHINFYESGFPTGNAYVNEYGELIQTIAGRRFTFYKQ